jgi:hypothetical protein
MTHHGGAEDPLGRGLLTLCWGGFSLFAAMSFSGAWLAPPFGIRSTSHVSLEQGAPRDWRCAVSVPTRIPLSR